MPDGDGDGLSDLATGSALNVVFGLPSVPKLPPDSVTDLACEAAARPGVVLTWTDPEGAETIRVEEITGGIVTVLGEVPAGAGELTADLAGSEDPRDFAVTALSAYGESPFELCTATMAPPPVEAMTCTEGSAGEAVATWVLPDPGLRVLDGVRLIVDGVEAALLPPDATSAGLGVLPDGTHLIVARTVWGPWDSPSFTCTLSIGGGITFIRGDGNGDSRVDIGDAIRTLAYLFGGADSTCPASMEANDDGSVDIGDAIYLLAFLFAGGPPPAPPFPECGTIEGADCTAFPGCAP
jgi:hypothetical protein